MATKLSELDLKKYNLEGYEFEELISEDKIKKKSNRNWNRNF